MRTLLWMCIGLLLVGCGGAAPPEGHASATMEEAFVRAGDVSIRASVVPTASINPVVANRYGIEPDRGSVLLLVGVRQGEGLQEAALPARITAAATDLRTSTLVHVSPGFFDAFGTSVAYSEGTVVVDLHYAGLTGCASEGCTSSDCSLGWDVTDAGGAVRNNTRLMEIHDQLMDRAINTFGRIT